MTRRARAMTALGLAAAACAGAGALRLPRTEPGLPPSTINSITSFAGDHPEWAILRPVAGAQLRDATALRLNHAVHLNPATLGMQDAIAALRESGRADATRLVTGESGQWSLSCATCHQPDETGRHMRPITFDAHCRSCHTGELGVFNPAPGVVPATPRPHGSVEALAASMDRALSQWAASAMSGRGAPPAPTEEAKPAEGGQPGTEAKPADGAPVAAPAPPKTAGSRRGKDPFAQVTSPEALAAWMSEERTKALDRAATGCGKCHTIDPAPEATPGALFAVRPPAIPDRWLPRSVFDHGAHEMLSCVSCHVGAPTSQLTADVLIPGIASCRECHAPRAPRSALASLLGADRPAAAPNSCVTCHIYHDRRPGGTPGTLTAPEFLGKRIVRPTPAETGDALPAPEPAPDPGPPAP